MCLYVDLGLGTEPTVKRERCNMTVITTPILPPFQPTFRTYSQRTIECREIICTVL